MDHGVGGVTVRAVAEAAGVATVRAAGVTYDVQAIPKTNAESLNDNA